MLAPLRILLFAPLFLFTVTSHAQDKDYLKHGKEFCVCSIKRECANCFSCGKERFITKIHNKTEKKINKISYKFYSSVFNRILEKDAKIEGDIIDRNHVAMVYVCVPEGLHWIISEVDYTDGSKQTYTLKDRMESFIQEADECDCNE